MTSDVTLLSPPVSCTRRRTSHSSARVVVRAVSCAASLEAVEDQIEAERELELVVARAEHAVVADRRRQLGDRAGTGRPSAGEDGVVLRAGAGRGRVLEQVLVEAEDAAAQDMDGVVGQRRPRSRRRGAWRGPTRCRRASSRRPAARSSITRGAHGWRSMTCRAAMICWRRAASSHRPGRVARSPR